jgi:ABC-2 type transport system permease protein
MSGQRPGAGPVAREAAPMAREAAPVAPGASPAGSIYDLGYRHYEGRRHGPLYAAWSLYVESLRGVWGFGRPATAKAVPLVLAGLYALPAVIQLAFSSYFAQVMAQGQTIELFTYRSYFSQFYFLILFFCIAQAPELVCRDQRYQVLPLYFTRAMGRIEYAIARLVALATGLFIVLMVPVVAIFVGDVLMKPDTFAAVADELPKALPALPASALGAVGMAAISLAVSSFSPRRAYSAIGILAYILLMEAIPASIRAVGERAGWGWTDPLSLLMPVSALDGANYWLFGAALPSPTFSGGITAVEYTAAAVVSLVVMTGVLFYRYRRMPA